MLNIVSISRSKTARSKSTEREADVTSEAERSGTDLSRDKVKVKDGAGSRSASPERVVALYDKDLIRMMAEVNFINGEVSKSCERAVLCMQHVMCGMLGIGYVVCGVSYVSDVLSLEHFVF